MKCLPFGIAAFFIGSIVLAQNPATPPATAAPKQDPAAVKLLQKHDSLMYVPQENGLKDVAFDIDLPINPERTMLLTMQVQWKAPEKVATDVVVPANTPADKKTQLELLLPTVKTQAKVNAPMMVRVVVGQSELGKRTGDEIVMDGENKVKVTAKSEASKQQFREELLTFDERGLVKSAHVTSPAGGTQDIDMTYTERKGKFFLSEVATKFGDAASGTTNTMKFEYADVDGITLVSKTTIIGTQGGKAGPETVMQFANYKVNKGIDDSVFTK